MIKNTKFHNYEEKVKDMIQTVREKYGINGKFSKADFYRICEAENIELFNKKEHKVFGKYVEGFLLMFDNRRFIFLKCFYLKRFDLFTAMHELGHHFLGHQGFQLRDKRLFEDSLYELEANLFAKLTTE